MSFLRTSTVFSSLTRRAPIARVHQPLQIRALSSTPTRLATQGYGDGAGDPKGEDPQAQGASNATKENAEHPGPEAPSTGNSSTGSNPEDASAQSGGSRSKEAKETGSSPTGGELGKQGSGQESKEGSKPKIHDKKDPAAATDEQQAEVEKHNREFEKGHDRAPPAEADKVDGKFWEGQGGHKKA